MKKGQTEIIGLMVIVILFIFGGMIYIMFAGKTDEGSITRDITQSTKVQNMLDAFIQITPCHTKIPFDQMDKIIKNCYISEGKDLICGIECKKLIEDTLETMIKEYNSKQKYYFKILDKKSEEFIKINEKCPPTAKTTPTATERILAAGETLSLKLTYCIN